MLNIKSKDPKNVIKYIENKNNKLTSALLEIRECIELDNALTLPEMFCKIVDITENALEENKMTNGVSIFFNLNEIQFLQRLIGHHTSFVPAEQRNTYEKIADAADSIKVFSDEPLNVTVIENKPDSPIIIKVEEHQQ